MPAANPANPFGDFAAGPDGIVGTADDLNPAGVVGADVRINRRFEESGGRLFTQSVDTFRFLTGLTGELENDWAWELSLLYAENEDTSETKNYGRFDRWAIMVDPAACGADPACVAATGGVGYLDPFGEFGTIPDSAFDYLFAGSLKDVYRNELLVYQANLTGDLGTAELPGGAIGWAVGAEHRRE
ncbi:MAG: hypothetical protein GWO04_16130, partial [Actinobacteria bacterium]|nr:hypothetical protein [Actinomycetota bacterium]